MNIFNALFNWAFQYFLFVSLIIFCIWVVMVWPAPFAWLLAFGALWFVRWWWKAVFDTTIEPEPALTLKQAEANAEAAEFDRREREYWHARGKKVWDEDFDDFV